MRKLLVVAMMLAAIAVPAVALSATLDTSKFGDLIAAGDACEDGAFYHFVNNQTGGAAAGTLTATFNAAPSPIVTGPYALAGPNVQHFSVFSEARLTGASTNLPGKLVLSGIDCAKKD